MIGESASTCYSQLFVHFNSTGFLSHNAGGLVDPGHPDLLTRHCTQLSSYPGHPDARHCTKLLSYSIDIN